MYHRIECARPVICALFGVLALFNVGCSSASKTKGDYLTAYQESRYAEAYDAATAAATKSNGMDRDRAALIAGQSAHAINRNADSKKWLEPLLVNPDDQIGGRAGATLGLIAIEENKHAEAAKLLSTASRKLAGDEAARAALYAGDSLRNSGNAVAARESYVRAQAMVKEDQQLKNQIAERLAGTPAGTLAPGKGRFSVQVGAFSTKQRAGEALVKFGQFGAARVATVKSKTGQALFAVRVGVYPSKVEAEKVRAKIGGDCRVVETADE